MRVHRRGRRAGKTIWMVSQVEKDPDGILVCMNEREADRLVKDYPEVPPGKFVTVAEVMQGKLRGLRPEPQLYIDNADIILTEIFRHRIVEISVTTEV